jgi:hypothetical protein
MGDELGFDAVGVWLHAVVKIAMIVASAAILLTIERV